MAKIYFSNLEDEEGFTEDLIGMRQALPVKPIDEDFDPNLPPLSGEEYLQHVVYEASKFGSVFTAQRVHPDTLNAKCDPNTLGLKPSLTKSTLMPDECWEQEQVNIFTKLRNRVHNLRLRNSPRNKSLQIPDVEATTTAWTDFLSSHKPYLSVVFALRQEQLERALSVLLNIHCVGKFSVEHGSWVYAIAACLDHPLSREACGDLRDIARRCALLRSNKNDAEDKEVTMMNLIITIVVKYYKQVDLLDST